MTCGFVLGPGALQPRTILCAHIALTRAPHFKCGAACGHTAVCPDGRGRPHGVPDVLRRLEWFLTSCLSMRGDLADLYEVAVRVAQVAANLAAVIYRLGEEGGAAR